MCLTEFVSGSILLALTTSLSLPAVLIVSFVTSVAGTYTELISHGGIDTITVSYANAAVLLLMISLL